jgi:enamine deaminase RidA (YjgF/YER057c/UK114 family)
VNRRLVSSGAPTEAAYGYCRAVVLGSNVYVSGTAPVMPNGAAPPPDAYGQAKRCLDIIVRALAEAGAQPKDVVRTRVYLVRVEDYDDVYRAHSEVFGDVRPANTGVVIAGLLDPRWLVEIEADAVLPATGS